MCLSWRSLRDGYGFEPGRTHFYLVMLLSGLWWFCQSTQAGAADELTGPLVIGFERFARHQEISADQAGALLLTELSCTACHASPLKSLEPKAGPKLESAGRRLRAAWMKAYLHDPAKVKPGSTMPDVLAGMEPAKRDAAVAALVAFLATQQAPFPELKASGAVPVPHEFWNKGDANSGKQLMHQRGCVTCHEPAADYEGGVQANSALEQMLEELEPEQIAQMGLTHAARTIPSVPLANLVDKYTRQGLAMFLFDPANVRPSGRMPNMKLRTADAADITAYLMQTPGSLAASGPVDARLRDEGKKLFVELGCANCHSATGVQAKAKPAKPLAAIALSTARSCTAAQASPGVPHFALDAAQLQAIESELAEIKTAKAATETPADQLSLSLLQLNCYACHQRDKLGGVARGRDRFFETIGQVDLGDEGRLPPPLTGVGRKLVTPWLKNVLLGNAEVRPHLQIRMPKYPTSEVEPLVALLAKVDGVEAAPGTKPTANVDKTLAEAGRTLFNLGCVQCHPLKGESLPSIVGVDVGRVGSRIRKQWFHDFLLNPASLKPRTRMPTFFAPGSVNQEVLSGDVEKQIEALWVYLEDIDRQPLPEKIETARRQNFELIPKDKPILIRTFMQLAGTHAIAVGFPEHAHYAFDSESVRLAELWGDRFLDAQGTWNDRFSPPAAPLTAKRIPLPTGPDFALLPNRNAAWPEVKLDSPLEPAPTLAAFSGYRFDKAGIPEFVYRVGPYTIKDRLVAKPGSNPLPNGFQREFTITLQPPPAGVPQPAPLQLYFRVAGSGKQLQRSGNRWVYASGLSVATPAELAAAVVTRPAQGSQIILALPAAPETKFSVEYRW